MHPVTNPGGSVPALAEKIQQRRLFFGLLLFIAAITGIFLLVTGKAQSFRILTSYHNSFGNVYFAWATMLGEGYITVVLTVYFLVRRQWFNACFMFASFAVSGIIAQIIKNILVDPRPKLYFEQLKETVYQVPGVSISTVHSFPSGHTTSAFALAVAWAFLVKDKWLQVLFLLLACIVGYSRLYLSQHFLTDVLAGSMLGTFSTIFCYWFLQQKQHWFMKKGV